MMTADVSPTTADGVGEPADRGQVRPQFSMVVPVLNAIRYLPSCLDALLEASRGYGLGEVIMVDNGSTDGSYEFVREQYADAVSVHQLRGVTISALRNYGARIARGDHLCFVDADCVVAPDYLHQAARVLASVRASACGSSYALPTPAHWIERVWHTMHARSGDGYVKYLNAGNFVVERAAFETVGGFEERLVTGEDAEIGQRLQSRGYRIFESHGVRVVHLGNPKTLRHFYRKQRWHALGMFGTFRTDILDRPVLMMFAFLLLNLLALGRFVADPSLGRLLEGGVLSLLVPAAATLFRARQTGAFPYPVKGTLLYAVYFSARLHALAQIVVSSKAWRRPTGATTTPKQGASVAR
jgi:glycosyltransferase involved in cell wall biosynthesis